MRDGKVFVMEKQLMDKLASGELRVTVIGLGYVGLPLAVAFGQHFPTQGFDLNEARIQELRAGQDHTLEQSPEQLATAKKLSYTSDPQKLRDTDIFIVTVPTPVDVYKRPDLTPLIKASETIGGVIRKGAVVVYESTVYPGCTEEDCIPVIERVSGMTFNVDFFAGYSPERINPGDKQHTVTHIKKVTSGSTPAIADFVDAFYRTVIEAGTHKASSIKVAEAAKVIENSQRDINIAFVNELSMIFHKMGIDTLEVLEAAGSKWNFLPFRPGLVGGHCIGVDPYYLTHKAAALGYHPEIILAGRRLNDNMAGVAARETIKLMIRKGLPVKDARVLVLGITFKENCPDIRNSKVVDVIHELQSFGCGVDVADPWADAEEVRRAYGVSMVAFDSIDPQRVFEQYQTVVLAVNHRQFLSFSFQRDRANTVLFDIKSVLPKADVDGRL